MDFRLFILTLVAGGLSMMAYLLGSFPTGYLVGKRQGIDIREHGSGSTGATNVWRVMGKGWGILVFAVDFLKGIVALGLGQLVYGSAHNLGVDLPAWGLPWVLTAMAGGAIVGHSLPVWLQWRGGKSVATGLGIMVYLHWQTAVMALTIWLVVMAFTRTVSLSSLIAAVSTPILLILWQGEIAYQLLAGVGALYIIYTHRANVQRLLKGEEHSFAPKI